jgi:hypothetical protein
MKLLPRFRARQPLADRCAYCRQPLGAVIHAIRTGYWDWDVLCFHDDQATCRLAARSLRLTERQVRAYMERTGWAMHYPVAGGPYWTMPYLGSVSGSIVELASGVAALENRHPEDVLYDMLAQDLLDGLAGEEERDDE